MGLTRILGPTAVGGALLGSTALGYALWEARQFTLRQVAVPLLPPGQPLMRVLHLSDLHLTPAQDRKIAALSGRPRGPIKSISRAAAR